MDLGIAGRWAIVCASTEGLGLASARALAGEGVNVVVNGRNADKAQRRACELQTEFGTQVVGVGADLATAEGLARLVEVCPSPDIVVTNNRGPKPGTLAEVTDEDFEVALDLHYRAPIRLVRYVIGGMRARRFGRIVNLTSAMVTTPSEFMVTSAGARAGLTAVMKAVARDVVVDNVTVNNVLPERIDSPRQIQMARWSAKRDGTTFEQARAAQAESIRAKRLGLPEEVGAAVAFLCSQQASYISGVNLHLDGGSYPGLI